MSNSTDLPSELRIPEREIELLYSIDWWDGPLTGLVRCHGRLFWFEYYHVEDDERNYYYWLHPIPVVEEEATLAWFAQYKDYQHRWRPLANNRATRNLPSTLALTDEWKAFIATRFDYTSRPATGWFQSGENASFYAIQVTPRKDD